MKPITFFDIEVAHNSDRILDIGGITESGNLFHSNSIAAFISFIRDAEYICGHNIINHDLKFIKKVHGYELSHIKCIDTLYLSPLLFPAKPYHALIKDDKLQTEELNNPLNDSIKAKELFYDEINAFLSLEPLMQSIFYMLLSSSTYFKCFFDYLSFKDSSIDCLGLIKKHFKQHICANVNLSEIISGNPVELAYCLALINADIKYSITPPWVLLNFPKISSVMIALRNKECLEGCAYCNQNLDVHKGLKDFFGFDLFRLFDSKPLQKMAVEAAVANKSILTIFPTGGGKSLTFQLPALMAGRSIKGLTVVISPLQSLMKDQIDNLEKIGIVDAVTINGLLDPIERAKSVERVKNGMATLLYISPESLRSKTIEKLLVERNVVRIVIDEAHCFSSWGQEFRVDYLYIAKFIRELQKQKKLTENIPVSCFTATAKPKVIEDIIEYFKLELGIDIELFSSDAARTNLSYNVIEENGDEEKYLKLRSMIEAKSCPTIIYVSRTRRAYEMALRLSRDGFPALPYHGKMERNEKTSNQNSFMKGEVDIIVATSAFGMGVDKKDVARVIHFDISDSLENYVQESGRAGRDESISADCYILYNDNDLTAHFVLLNQTKISVKDIQQIWKAIKDLTKYRLQVSQSALEIARKAGWDDTIVDLETKVYTAISALEQAGFILRGQNMPKIYANSILAKNVEEAFGKIDASHKFNQEQNTIAKRIIKMLISSRSKSLASNEEAEARVDYISDQLGLVKETVIAVIYLLREELILSDAKDLTAYIKSGSKEKSIIENLFKYLRIERYLSVRVKYNESIILNEKIVVEHMGEEGHDVTREMLTVILNYWSIKGLVKKHKSKSSKDHVEIYSITNKENFKSNIEKRYALSDFIIKFLVALSEASNNEDKKKEEVLVEFSVMDIKHHFEKDPSFEIREGSIAEIEEVLYFLSKIDCIKIEGGFMVTYKALTIERKDSNLKRRYRTEDYRKLDQYYENKVMQIHIVGEYARKMIENYKEALKFVDDYFKLSYTSFLKKYFSGEKLDEIKRSITPAKFRQLFGELSPVQLKIINDKSSKYIVVAAGPGSGKTRILVHKLASLLLMEDVRHEQLLMLTFSRAAASEFKTRLIKLIGKSASFVEIKTFHSFCFDILGKVGSLEKSSEIIREAIDKIKAGELDPGRLTKTVLVIDEAQDIDSLELELIKAIMEYNEEMRVIAVGDDDQSIYGFRGASPEHMNQFVSQMGATLYEMVENYRSAQSIIHYSNIFIQRLPDRLKNTPIIPIRKEKGEIKLVKYKNTNLSIPLVSDVIAKDLRGTTCVLTMKNDEALQITGLLTKHKLKAKLIQSNEGFNLYNLKEIRFFLKQLSENNKSHKIDNEVWENAKNILTEIYYKSINLEKVNQMLRVFEASNPGSKFFTDLEGYIRESRLEDFLKTDSDTIYVSTMHKAKGKEFDNIFLMLDCVRGDPKEMLRLLYVAITRARNNLYIYTNGNWFDFENGDIAVKHYDEKSYEPPEQLSIQLNYSDVYLDSFYNSQYLLRNMTAGSRQVVVGYLFRLSYKILLIQSKITLSQLVLSLAFYLNLIPVINLFSDTLDQ